MFCSVSKQEQLMPDMQPAAANRQRRDSSVAQAHLLQSCQVHNLLIQQLVEFAYSGPIKSERCTF